MTDKLRENIHKKHSFSSVILNRKKLGELEFDSYATSADRTTSGYCVAVSRNSRVVFKFNRSLCWY